MKFKVSLETIKSFLDPVPLGQMGIQSTSWVSQQQLPEELGPQPQPGFQLRNLPLTSVRLAVSSDRQDL